MYGRIIYATSSMIVMERRDGTPYLDLEAVAEESSTLQCSDYGEIVTSHVYTCM